MDLSEFDYRLPEELIAQEPLADRAGSRMLILYRAEGRWEDRWFRELPQFLGPGDCLALNDSRVFPARLFGHRAGIHALPIGKTNPKRQEFLSGQIEVLLLRRTSEDGKTWEALVRPGRKLRVGERIHFHGGPQAEIVGRGAYGERQIRFETDGDLLEEFEKIGHIPLPPYIKRGDEAADRERYQTVYARQRGSVAAPTAGLHFTPEILAQCRAAGAEIAYLTLHVGLGTFQPLHEEQIALGRLHAEWFRISAENQAKLRAAGRVVAVGTTSVRAIESALHSGRPEGETEMFIQPGYQFRGVGAVLTNFHLPRTSLILLVSAFAGRELMLAAYRHAVEKRYRFYSYGDCMLVL